MALQFAPVNSFRLVHPSRLRPANAVAAAAPAATSGDAPAGSFQTVLNTTAPASSPAAAATGQNAVPTAESVFGDNPWMASPTGTNPTGTYSMNPYYFATAATAQKVAQMVGGTVVEVNAYSVPGLYVQNQPNELVKLPSGKLVNPGLIASFYTHGYPQSTVDQMVANEING